MDLIVAELDKILIMKLETKLDSIVFYVKKCRSALCTGC